MLLIAHVHSAGKPTEAEAREAEGHVNSFLTGSRIFPTQSLRWLGRGRRKAASVHSGKSA